jgi:hypothetical protein
VLRTFIQVTTLRLNILDRHYFVGWQEADKTKNSSYINTSNDYF